MHPVCLSNQGSAQFWKHFWFKFWHGKRVWSYNQRLITHTTHEECISLTEQNRWTTSGALTPFMHPHFRDCDVHDSSHLAENRLTGKSLMAFTRYQSVLCLDWTTSCTSQAGGGPFRQQGCCKRLTCFGDKKWEGQISHSKWSPWNTYIL